MTSPPTAPLRLHSIANSSVPGLAVAERRVANPQATIICVHDALDRGSAFARLARRLDTFNLEAYDHRNHQGSRALTPLGLDYHVDEPCALVQHDAQRHPVIIFGHSFRRTRALE